jgi:hypothetical protein
LICIKRPLFASISWSWRPDTRCRCCDHIQLSSHLPRQHQSALNAASKSPHSAYISTRLLAPKICAYSDSTQMNLLMYIQTFHWSTNLLM